MTQHKVTSE